MPEAIPFPRSTPEAQGIQSSAVLSFLDAVERNIRDLHSIILLRRGAVVAEGYWEPYGATYPHMLFSLSKSFTSTAIGMLVADGRLNVEDHVLDYFRDEAPSEPSDNLRAMRVRHLLTMTTGHDTEPPRVFEQPGMTWVRGFLAHPVEHQPGTHFLYNSMATYTLSAIVQKITGERVIHFLQPRLFAPLGIQNPTWETSPEGIDAGGWGLSITTQDIARFGQLYLQRGIWQGQRLLSESWVEAATSRQVPNGPNANVDWEQGYGYQFWRCRHGAYRGDGAFGQFCIVMPDQEAVLAVTSGVSNMQAVLDLVWEHLLPAMGADPLADDPSKAKALTHRLAMLRLTPTAGRPESPRVAVLSGQEFILDHNPDGIESIAFDFAADSTTLTIRNDRGEQRIPCGSGRWLRSEITILGAPRALGERAALARVAASGAWSDEQTYVAELYWYETPFRRTLTCRFDGDRVVIEQQLNVGFGTTALPRLEGTASR